MKRLLSLLVLLAMFASIPSFAADKEDGNTDALSVSYPQIEALILENNPDLQVARLRQSLLAKNDKVSDAVDALWSLYSACSAAKTQVDRTIAEMEEAALFGASADPAVHSALSGTSASLSYALADLSQQMKSIGASDTDKKQAAIEVAQAEARIVSAAKKLFIGVHALKIQRTDLSLSKGAADRALSELTSRYNLGQISELDLLQAQDQAARIEDALLKAENALTDACGEFNLLFGRAYLLPLEFCEPDAPSLDFLKTRDASADLSSALKNNYVLKSLRLSLSDLSDSGKYDSTKTERQALKLQISAKEAQITGLLDRLGRAVAEKERGVLIEQNSNAYQQRKLAAAGLKYQLGLISSNQLALAQDDLIRSRGSLRAAENDLLLARQAYEELVAGLSE